MSDRRYVKIRLITLKEQEVGEMSVPPRSEGEEPRTFMHLGVKFKEDESGYYGEHAAVEIADQKDHF